MRRGQHSVEQIIGILKQHEGGRPLKELCRQYGFSEVTFKRWKSKYKGMHVEEAEYSRYTRLWLTTIPSCPSAQCSIR